MNGSSGSAEQGARRVAVIGGGISGLAAAHRLHEIAPHLRVSLYEASDRLGGVLQTVHRDGYLMERSADNFITNQPWAIDLCRRVGLGDALLSTDSRFRQAFVVSHGRLRKIPDGFLIMAPTRLWPVVTTPILSPLGKLRLAAEWFVPRRKRGDGDGAEPKDESLAVFATRRMGRATYERLVQPLVGGIYTADPERLSVLATMPRFVEMEQRHGSLIAAAWHDRRARKEAAKSGGEDSGARYSMFVAPREGMSSLVDAIAARLPRDAIHLGYAVETVRRRDDGRYDVRFAAPASAASGATPGNDAFDAVVIATPASRAAKLVGELGRELGGEPAGELAQELGAIEHAGAAIVTLAYSREQIAHALDGFGFVVPIVERRRILSASFSSVKYPGRAPAGKVLVRVFVGGACQGELLNLDDDALRHLAHEELAALIGVSGPPSLSTVTRWNGAMPQYHVGHLDRVARIEAATARYPGLQLAGSAYRGVGVPQCIHSGEQAAERVAEFLKPQ